MAQNEKPKQLLLCWSCMSSTAAEESCLPDDRQRHQHQEQRRQSNLTKPETIVATEQPRPLGGSENQIPYIDPLYPPYNPYIFPHMVLGDLVFRSLLGSGKSLMSQGAMPTQEHGLQHHHRLIVREMRHGRDDLSRLSNAPPHKGTAFMQGGGGLSRFRGGMNLRESSKSSRDGCSRTK